jgi:hypothetical protein
VLREPVEPRPDESSDPGGQRQRVGDVTASGMAIQLVSHNESRKNEPDHPHEAQAVDLERAQLEEDRAHRSGRRRGRRECRPLVPSASAQNAF